MDKFTFTQKAFDEYLYWQAQDKKTLKRINLLLKDIMRNPFDGIGKPEPLRYLPDCWSRRIDDNGNRVVYRVKNGSIEILQCKGHYDD